MAKFKALKGIAHNLADSFTSAVHIELVHELLKEASSCKIDFLNKKVTPSLSSHDLFDKYIALDYGWFLEEISKANIKLMDIERVTINLTRKPSYTVHRHGVTTTQFITASVLIKVKDKEFTGVVSAGWS